MTKRAPEIPECPTCNGRRARLTTGAEVYPHRPDLHAKHIWICDGCNGYVGCHGETTKSLGTPANAALRKARMILHDQMIDPLWMEADRRRDLYQPEDEKARRIIRNSARGRVYGFLAHHMGLPREKTHTGMFDLAQCRQAWTILNRKTYAEIRGWSKAQAASDREKKAAPRKPAALKPKNNRVAVGTGRTCPKCPLVMQRFKHPEGWKPRPGRSHFAYWDACECGFVQHYAGAHVAAGASS